MAKQILFFSGEAMDPQAIRANYPAARFLARARLMAAPGEISPFFSRILVGRGERAVVWGIAVETGAAVDGHPDQATTDEGTVLAVTRVEHPLVAGTPEAVLDAALYWELPPAYTTLLREAAGISAPDAEGGWETMALDPAPGTAAE